MTSDPTGSAPSVEADPAVPAPTAPHPGRIAWFHCFSGIAGDMALGALLDAGADLDEVRSLVRRVALPSWDIEAEPVLRGGIAATAVTVRTSETGVVRTASAITELVRQAGLPPRVAERALATFARLAAVEGRLHRRPPEQVHFHEVGGVDAIVDVVGTAAALEVLDVGTVAASPVALGAGMVRTEHGLLPNPAPAVVGLLAAAGAPTYGVDQTAELTTPTGAALLAALSTSWGPQPPLRTASCGYGAGSRELDGRPNMVQVVVGDATDEEATPAVACTVLAVNLDDVTGEVLADAVAAALAAGAFDAWVTPAVMKKGRPGHVVEAVCDPALGGAVAASLLRTTGSWGLRATRAARWQSARSEQTVRVGGLPVRVKIGTGRVSRAKPEHDDVVAVAEATGLPPAEVARAALEALGPSAATAAAAPRVAGPGGPPAPDEPPRAAG